jgi:hypothetical protein
MRVTPIPGLSLAAALGALALAALAVLHGCGGPVYPDRDPVVVENVRVDSVKFLPFGSRFVLSDSATSLRLLKVHLGYACTKVLESNVDSVPSGTPASFRAVTRILLPAAPDCAVDTVGFDTTVPHVFGADLGFVRVANSAGTVTDSARVVRGTIAFDSLKGILGIAGTVSKGSWTFRDSSVLAPRLLFGDSLPSCRYLNQADFKKSKDTVTVHFSYVTLDSSAAPDTCRGASHSDSLPPDREKSIVDKQRQ